MLTPGLGLLIDGVIILAYFVLIITIGLRMGRRDATLAEFALGGRGVPWWAVMASIIAAETSAATFLSVPSEGYVTRAIIYSQIVWGLIIGRILVGYIFLRPYFLLRVYTVYDFLEIRFGKSCKYAASAMFLIMRTLSSGSRVYIPTIVMVLAWYYMQQRPAAATGASSAALLATASASTLPYFIAIVLLVIATGIYTTIGGIKAVIWTDVVQAALMFMGALVAIATLLYHIGGDSLNPMDGLRALGRAAPNMRNYSGYFLLGWEDHQVAEWLAQPAQKSRGLTRAAMSAWDWACLIFASPYTLFSALIASTLGNMAVFGTDQDMVQRMLTAETYKKSRRSLITSAVADLPIAAAFSFIGVLLAVYYDQHAELRPAANKDIFSAYIINVMPVGIRGLVLAGVFATGMGTLSAALNALATSATNDWYMPFFGRGKSEAQIVRMARIMTVVFAVLMVLIATVTAWVAVNLPQLRIIPLIIGAAGLFVGPMLGVFLVGMLTTRRGSDIGNVLALGISFWLTFYITRQFTDIAALVRVPIPVPEWIPKVAFTWYAPLATVLAFAIAICFSTPEHKVREAAERMAAGAAEQEPATA